MYIFLLTVAIVCADQAVKYAVRAFMAEGQSIEIIKGFFSLTYYRNDGAAFSSFRGQQVLLIAASVIAIFVALFFLWKERKGSLLLRLALALIIGGGAGNLIDRAIFAEVTDMLDFSIFPPIFNVADIAVVLGCGLFIIYIVFDEKIARKGHGGN